MDVYNSETMVITPHTLYSWDWNFLTTRSYDYWWEHTPLTEVNTISSALSRFRTAVSKARGRKKSLPIVCKLCNVHVDFSRPVGSLMLLPEVESGDRRSPIDDKLRTEVVKHTKVASFRIKRHCPEPLENKRPSRKRQLVQSQTIPDVAASVPNTLSKGELYEDGHLLSGVLIDMKRRRQENSSPDSKASSVEPLHTSVESAQKASKASSAEPLHTSVVSSDSKASLAEPLHTSVESPNSKASSAEPLHTSVEST
ncbi:uncharacterized protein [Spinacia oleracea]|uniref:Uncharacterized protein isoform X1 n=1 Tax=Spinacia oleracea TaxID=3562 RepID=A0A9R0J1F1_SPIOL|nr:uncharacterized protein LOC110797942 isoform X1 [Spinacia oleracea]